jgi:hypothetical protein
MERDIQGIMHFQASSLQRTKKTSRYGVKSLQAQNRFTTIPPPGGSIQRAWAEIRPVDANSHYLACNKPGAAAKISAPVAAGASITAYWNNKESGNPWPHAGGPMTVWMAECKGECSSWGSPAEGEWFKIYQSGLVSGTIGHGKWGTNEMIDKGFSLTVKIPATLKPGNYLIRHETIVSFKSFPSLIRTQSIFFLTGEFRILLEPRLRCIPSALS